MLFRSTVNEIKEILVQMYAYAGFPRSLNGIHTFMAVMDERQVEGIKENNSPHVSVKLWPGRSEQTKQRLADAIVEDVVNVIGCDEESVSVSIEDVSSGDWKEKVYDPEIRGNMKNLYKKPGYSM